jgi:ActR/RegA family two-component response regulator
MNFLIIEDDEYKKDKITYCLEENFSDINYTHVQSVSSALNELDKLDSDTIVLLDMSLPTYDLDESNSGGRPQGFGGIEILRNMEFYDLTNKVLVITQYESIAINNRVLDVNDLRTELANEFPDSFCELIQFNVVSDSWKKELIQKLTELIDD